MKGFSVIEVLLAAAIFMIFSIVSGTVVLQGFSGNRLGEEQTVANQYAAEGLEAVRSIKNQTFSNLVNSVGTGILQSGGVWTFAGGNNQFGPSNKYTRVLTVSDVQRDGSGNIVASGGTVDPLTKKITSTVSWNFSPTRADSVVLNSYLTNWKAAIGKGGMLVYGNGGTTSDAIQYQTIDSNGTWSAAANTADIDTGSTNKALRVARVYSSATRNEKILISRHYNGTTQFIYAQVFDGTTWGNVQLLSSWTASTFLDVQNFDGTYLSNGNFMTVYSDNTVTPKMATWNGTAWTTGSSLTTLGAGNIPNYIVAKARSGTNEVMAAFFTQASDSITQYYSGSTWSVITVHSTTAPVNTKKLVDFDWSPNNVLIGGLIYSTGSSDRSLHIKTWTANGSGSGSWSTVANTSTQGSNTTRLGAMAIEGRPGANEFIACNDNTVPNIICYKSTFTVGGNPTWTNPTNQTIANTTVSGIQRTFHIGYEATSGDPAINVYSDNTTTPKLKKYTASTSTWDAAATPLTTLADVLSTVSILPTPGGNDIMILLGSATRSVSSIIWDGTNNLVYSTPAGKAITTHGANGSTATEYWYDFAWDNF